MTIDPEISTMEKVFELYQTLGQDQRIRLTQWLSARFNLKFVLTDGESLIKKKAGTVVVMSSSDGKIAFPATGVYVEPSAPATASAPVAAITPTPVETAPETLSADRGEGNGKNIAEKAVPVEPETAASRALEAYDSLDRLFNVAHPRRVGGRILLAAAYLQEKRKLSELTSLEINRALKEIGKGVPNITLAINRMVEKIPQVMTVTRKDGDTKQGRRYFKVTDEGFREARSMIKIG